MKLFTRWLICSLLIIPIINAARGEDSFLDELRLNSLSNFPSTAAANNEPSFDAELPDDDSLSTRASSSIDRMTALEPDPQFDDPRLAIESEAEISTGRTA